MTNTEQDNQPVDGECLGCQYQRRLDAGLSLTMQERNHYMMWGCTCDPSEWAAALEWFDRISR